MKNTRKALGVGWCSALLALTTLMPQKTTAAPYASSLTNNAGVISFRLNESANAVAVIFTNLSGTLVTSNLGPKSLGLTVSNLFVPGSFTVSVTNSAVAGYVSGFSAQISNDSTNGTIATGIATNTLRFNAPRGVAINQNPASPFFGRIYVANAIGGVATRALGDGIYVLNADLSDAVGQGTNARNAGITAFTNTIPGSTDDGNTPWRLEVGEDSNLYISDFSLTNGNIYVTDPSVVTGTNVLTGFGTPAAPNGSPNHGRIGSSVIAKGSLAGGNLVLYAIDSDNSATSDTAVNHIIKFPVGAGPLPISGYVTNITSVTNYDVDMITILSIDYTTNVANGFTNTEASSPVALLSISGVTVDLANGPDGKFYMLQNRSDGLEAGVQVVDSLSDVGTAYSTGGDGLWDRVYSSLDDSQNNFSSSSDILKLSRAVKISPDGKYMAIIRDDNQIWVIQLVNGIPDLSTRKLVANTTATSIGRDISFDAAGNLYTVSSGQALMRVFSPGFKTIAQTGSQGTFFITNIVPTNVVTVAATVATATEDIAFPTGTNAPAVFTFTRTGDLSLPLTATYAVSGTATRALDYATNGLSGAVPIINGLITFAAGEASTNIYICAQNDILGETNETVIFTMTSNTNYFVGGTGNATVQILDDGDAPAVSVKSLGGSYELLPGRPAKFNLNMPISYFSDLTVNIALTGTAISGADYSNPSTFSVLLKAGISSTNFTITPYGNSLTNSKTIIATVLAGSVYIPDPASPAATNILRADYLTPTTTMFVDNFDTDTTASWSTRSISGTNSDATFNYDYSLIGVPVAPHTTNGTTRGLRLRAHFAAAVTDGISTSPIGKAFTNDYRLRFDLWMNYNGPLAAGGAGSSEYFTTGLGVSETRTNIGGLASPLPGSSVIFAVSGDGGYAEAAGDYIVSTNGVLTTSNSVAIYPAASRDNFNSYYSEFGELTAPAAQTALYPTPAAGANQSGTSPIGSMAFAWHDVVITKIGTVYTWTVDGLKIASVDYGTATVGTNFSLGYQDGTTSVMDNPLMNNAIVDNLIVEKLISTNALLANLVVTTATLSPAFNTGVSSYSATNAYVNNAVTVTASAAGGSAPSLRLSLNGGAFNPITSGVASAPQALSLSPSLNTLTVRVISEDGLTTNLYTVNVKLLPSQTVPALTNSYNGSALSLTWAADHTGYRLLTQTNTLSTGLGTNWTTVSGSDLTNAVTIPVNSANGAVFYKLIYP